MHIPLLVAKPVGGFSLLERASPREHYCKYPCDLYWGTETQTKADCGEDVTSGTSPAFELAERWGGGVDAGPAALSTTTIVSPVICSALRLRACLPDSATNTVLCTSRECLLRWLTASTKGGIASLLQKEVRDRSESKTFAYGMNDDQRRPYRERFLVDVAYRNFQYS